MPYQYWRYSAPLCVLAILALGYAPVPAEAAESGKPDTKNSPTTRIVKIPAQINPIETVDVSLPIVHDPSSPEMPFPAADAGRRISGSHEAPLKAEIAPEKSEPVAPQPPVKIPPGETVPEETIETLSEETHPKQEHVLKSLPLKGGYTVIPLPAFSYTRNENYWLGALMPILRTNEKEELEDIYAPIYLHNKFIGESFSLNYYGYRSEAIQYRATASYATKVERDFELAYKNTGAGGGRYILAAEGNWFKNAFARFFGLGNGSGERNETTYTSREGNIRLSAGLNLGQAMSVLWTERYRDVRVDDGIIPTLPQTKARFPTVDGISGAQIFGHRLTLLYDDRDNLLTPLKGSYALLYGEFANNLHSSRAQRWARISLDARHLMPHASGRMVFVSRILIHHLFSEGVPFYERPMLGGENTLRAFGLNRFINDNLVLINLEERIRVLEKRVFDNPVELQIAPFLDMGRVSRSISVLLRHTQFNPGIGLRVLSRPNVVGRLDVAYGKDGGNVFVGLDYPF